MQRSTFYLHSDLLSSPSRLLFIFLNLNIPPVLPSWSLLQSWSPDQHTGRHHSRPGASRPGWSVGSSSRPPRVARVGQLPCLTVSSPAQLSVCPWFVILYRIISDSQHSPPTLCGLFEPVEPDHLIPLSLKYYWRSWQVRASTWAQDRRYRRPSSTEVGSSLFSPLQFSKWSRRGMERKSWCSPSLSTSARSAGLRSLWWRGVTVTRSAPHTETPPWSPSKTPQSWKAP